MPDSLVSEFGPRLAEKDWSFLDGLSPDQMDDQFEAAATVMVDEMFPKKKVTIIEGDLPFFTEELRQLRRQRNRAYQRDGRSANYLTLQRKFQDKLKCEALKYKEKILQEVRSGKRGSGYTAIRKLGESSLNREQRQEFRIPAYDAEGLEPQEAVQRLATHFSAISQTVAPLEIKNFHPALRQTIEQGRNCSNKPTLSQHTVYRKLLRIKKPNSSVDGDIPKKLIQEYPFLWAGPARDIFNQIIQTAEWPQKWKIEHAIALHKTATPSQVESEDDVRTISKTNFLSK
jgi:hypothetical protein